MKIEDAIVDFIQYCLFEKGLTDQTVKSYQNDLNVYFEFLNNRGINNVRDIRSEDIKEFLKVRGDAESTSTLAHNLTVIKNFHKYLLKENLVKEDSSLFISRPKLRKKLPRSLTVEEVDLLLDIPLSTPFDYRNKAMLELMYGAGLRVSELVSLTTNQIDLENGMIRIMGKGRKEREIPIGEYGIFYLKKYLEHRGLLLKKQRQEDALFLNNHGKQITRQGFFKILKGLLLDKGLNPDISPHKILQEPYASRNPTHKRFPCQLRESSGKSCLMVRNGITDSLSARPDSSRPPRKSILTNACLWRHIPLQPYSYHC